MTRRKTLFKKGDRVRVSSEEPLFDVGGGRFDGKRGKILRKFKQGRIRMVEVRLDDGRVLTFGRGLLAAPPWFEKLSSMEMNRLIRSD